MPSIEGNERSDSVHTVESQRDAAFVAPEQGGGKDTVEGAGAPEAQSGGEVQAPSPDSPVQATAPTDQAVPKKKMSLKKKIILIAACAVAVCAVGIVITTVNAANSVRDYKTNAKTFELEVLDASTNLETIGNAEQSAWHEYIFGTKKYNGQTLTSIDDAVDAAQAEQASNIAKAKSEESAVDSMYIKIKTPPNSDDKDIQEISAAVKTLYGSYQDFYDTVIDVSGNYTTWTTKFSENDTAVSKAFKQLKPYLES